MAPWKAAVAYVLLFLLAVGCGMAAAAPATMERAGRKLEAALERALDLDLDIGRTEWTSDGTVVLSDVTVRDPHATSDEPALAMAERIVARVDPLWTRQKVRLKSVEVSGAHVSLIRRADGTDNVRAALRGVVRLLGGGDGGPDGAGRAGSLAAHIDRHVPEVLVTGLSLAMDAGRPLGLLPRHISFDNGTLTAVNRALLREDDHFEIAMAFSDSSLDPGHGVTVETKIALAELADVTTAPPPVSVVWGRPMRVKFGRRLLAVGGLRWDGERASVEQVALSVPVSEAALASSEPVEPALAARRISVQVDLDAVTAVVRALVAGADFAEQTPKLMSAMAWIEVDRPTLVFERRPEGHNFQDLVPERAPSEASLAAGPDKALGPLMLATRAATRSLLASAPDRDGRNFRGFLVRGFGRLERAIVQVNELAVRAAGVFPFHTVRVRGGSFAWRDLIEVDDGGVNIAGRLENFDMDATLEGDLLSFDASFIAPGSERAANTLNGKVQLATGTVQLHAGIGHLRLHPYRHIFPASVPIDEDTRIQDTELTLVWTPASQVARIEGELSVVDANFQYRPLAAEPLTGIGFTLDFDAQLDTARKTLVLGKSRLKMGEVRTVVRLDAARYDEAPKLTGVFRLERTRAQDVVDAIPVELVPMLEGLKVAGTAAWQLDFSLDTSDMESLVYHSYPELHHFRVTHLGDRLDLDAVRGTFLHRIREADGTVHELLVGPGSQQWSSLGNITPYMVKAVTTTEDGSFFRHSGFSPFAIRQSIVTNLKKGGFYRGASTISQQVVKNLFLSREKTIARKLQELFITWQMEAALEKDRIMELYLNIIEFGPGIYGIRHASHHYFGKRPGALSALEAVFLASLIPNPKKYYHQYSRGEVTDGWRRHLRWIMGVMVDRGKIGEEEFLAASPWSPVFRGRQAPGDLAEPAELLPPDDTVPITVP